MDYISVHCIANVKNDHRAGLYNPTTIYHSYIISISIDNVVFLEFQRPLSHPVSDQRD